MACAMRRARIVTALFLGIGTSSCAWREEPQDSAPLADRLCENGIDEIVPEDGSTFAYYRGTIEFWLEKPHDAELNIVLRSGEEVVPGRTHVSSDRAVAYFRPKSPLEPETDYEATLDYCVGSATIQFTTSELGLPCDESLAGRVYFGDLSNGRAVSPNVFGELGLELLASHLLLGVVSEQRDSLDVLLTWTEADSIEQDHCYQTLELEFSYGSSPAFVFGPETLNFNTPSGPLQLVDLELSGTFSHDANYIGGNEIELTLDGREIYRYTQETFPSKNAEQFCEVAESFGAPCTRCPTDGQFYCQHVLIDRFFWESDEELALEPSVGTNDPDCDSPLSCSSSTSHGFHRGILLVMLLLGLRARRGERAPSNTFCGNWGPGGRSPSDKVLPVRVLA
jgi:hypothetical protein